MIVLNLVKKREKKRHESLLTEEYLKDVTYLNQFLPPQHHIQYIGFDMARLNKLCVAFLASNLLGPSETGTVTGAGVDFCFLLRPFLMRPKERSERDEPVERHRVDRRESDGDLPVVRAAPPAPALVHPFQTRGPDGGNLRGLRTGKLRTGLWFEASTRCFVGNNRNGSFSQLG